MVFSSGTLKSGRESGKHSSAKKERNARVNFCPFNPHPCQTPHEGRGVSITNLHAFDGERKKKKERHTPFVQPGGKRGGGGGSKKTPFRIGKGGKRAAL